MKRSICIISLFLAFSILLCGCGNKSKESVSDSGSTKDDNVVSGSKDSDDMESDTKENDDSSDGSSTAATTVTPINEEYFSNRDFEVDYDESKSTIITLNGDSAVCSSNAVRISGSTVTITDEGTYILNGTLEDGMIIVNSEKTDKTQLVLNNVTIHSETSAAIYILQSDKVFITTASGTTNTLSNGGAFEAIDENNIDAAIFSKEDLTLNGSGTLVVTSPAGHGIVSKDSLRVTSGIYDINCASHALTGKDDVCIANADFTIVSGKDGIHAENADDAAYGYVYIQSGTFNISSQGDGISAGAYMQIEDGIFDITSGGGSENATAHSSDSWGNFMGGGRHQMGQFGPSMSSSAAGTSTETEEESTSIKGIKASGDLTVNGGTFTINSADDSVHSNASVTINGGSFNIAAGDDAFHADDTLTVTDGMIQITESYEGMEGLHIVVSGGEITLIASDDGLNAAGGTDASGTGGRDAMMGGHGMASSSSNGSILISGGTLHVTASGDGIDANGYLEITGGYTVVCGPTQGDTATLDYDSYATISGGTFIGTGASGMAQTFSSSEQGVIAVNVRNATVGSEILISDSKGNNVLTYTPELAYAVIIFSSPDVVSGETYTLTAGTVSGEIAAD